MTVIPDDILKHKLGFFSADRSEAAYAALNGDSESLQHALERHYQLPPTTKQLHEASKKIRNYNLGIVIPMRERGPRIKPVLEVLTRQVDPESIVVVNDDSDDDALETVREFDGVRLIFRNDVLDTLDWGRLLPLLNLEERPIGKGVAVLAGYLAQYAMFLNGQKHKWLFQNDSEIAEYARYQCIQHLVAGLIAHPTALAVKTAKFGRTNERSMCMRSAMGLLAELPGVPAGVAKRASQIFRLAADKWIQTGEFGLKWDVAMSRPFATGYLEESLIALFCEDFFVKQGKGYTLKVANPNPRLDGANDDRKEAIMQQQVSNFWLSMAFWQKPACSWTLRDIRGLNHGILSKNITMAWIPPNDGPCQAEVVRNDRVFPSVRILVKNRFVNLKALRKLV